VGSTLRKNLRLDELNDQELASSNSRFKTDDRTYLSRLLQTQVL
jgi:hypothetical protein